MILTVYNSELPNLAALIEELIPDMNASPINSLVDGVSIPMAGSITIAKVINAKEPPVVLTLNLEPGSPPTVIPAK